MAPPASSTGSEAFKLWRGGQIGSDPEVFKASRVGSGRVRSLRNWLGMSVIHLFLASQGNWHFCCYSCRPFLFCVVGGRVELVTAVVDEQINYGPI